MTHRSRDLLRYLEGGQGGTAGLVPAGGVQPLVQALERVASARGKTAAQVRMHAHTHARTHTYSRARARAHVNKYV